MRVGIYTIYLVYTSMCQIWAYARIAMFNKCIYIGIMILIFHPREINFGASF